MDNQRFLEIVRDSFKKFLETNSRSNEKLKILHGNIAEDILQRLNSEDYSVFSLGIGEGQEKKLKGRYIEKAVDITIMRKNIPIAGIGVKFVMQNYSQNSNNYFENMLGETANIRSANIPYFQIFIIPDKLPYYNNSDDIKKWESFTTHNSEKYLALSRDDIQTSIHTPTKTLLFVVHFPDIEANISRKTEYKQYYLNVDNFVASKSTYRYGDFSSSVIYNDYEDFAKKVVHYIKFI